MASAMLSVLRDVSTFDICDGVTPGDNCIEKVTMMLDSAKRRLALPYTVIEAIVTSDASTPAMVANSCFIESAIVKKTSSDKGNKSSMVTTGASTGLVDEAGVVE